MSAFNRSHQLAIDNQSEPDEDQTYDGDVALAFIADGLEQTVIEAAVYAVRYGELAYLRRVMERHLPEGIVL